jgi:hypothetical protein
MLAVHIRSTVRSKKWFSGALAERSSEPVARYLRAVPTPFCSDYQNNSSIAYGNTYQDHQGI